MEKVIRPKQEKEDEATRWVEIENDTRFSPTEKIAYAKQHTGVSYEPTTDNRPKYIKLKEALREIYDKKNQCPREKKQRKCT